MSRPRVGITVSLDPGVRIRAGVDYLYVNRSYARAVREAGGLPLLLGPEADPREAVGSCDGLVISGGGDLPATLDGPEPPAAERPERVAWERRLLDAAHSNRRPLLGVCYGMQLVNLHAGGTLYPDLSAALPGALDHGGGASWLEHPVETVADAPLHDVLGARVVVSSSHRQAVDRVAPGLRVAARAPDGVVEAVVGEGLLGVEWHPESDATGAALYAHFLRAVEGAG